MKKKNDRKKEKKEKIKVLHVFYDLMTLLSFFCQYTEATFRNARAHTHTRTHNSFRENR